MGICVTREIRFFESLNNDRKLLNSYVMFMQRMSNRLAQGSARYGNKPLRDKRYMARIFKELEMYKKTGNMENLINISNYCWLESEAPQNKKFNFDPYAFSATRL